MPAIRNFAFDLDGTLIDTERAVLLAWQDTLAGYGYARELDELRGVLGVTNEAGVASARAQVDEDFGPRWRDAYARHATGAGFFPGVREALLSLRAAGCAVGAVSSRDRAEYHRFFSDFGLGDLLDVVVLEEDTARHKPEADPLLKYLELTGSAPEETVYVGDIPGDIACANAAGVKSALVAWNGSHITCPAADFVLHSPEQLLHLADAR